MPLWLWRITDAEQEAAETQIWLETARECGYVTADDAEALMTAFEQVIRQ